MVQDEKERQVFKALADDTRRRILDLVKNKAMTTGQLCNKFGQLDRCTTMQHLRVLEKAGLIIVRREGRLRWNYLDSTPIQQIYDRWISRYAQPSVELMTRLKQDLEEK